MKELFPIMDNIDELLAKIIEFTELRREVLTENLKNVSSSDFVPKDLPVQEFADAINGAIDEHVRNERLVLCDSDNIRFGDHGSFVTAVVVDEKAEHLLENDMDEYLKLEADHLVENRLNNIVATDLLKQKQREISALSDYRL